MIKCRRIIVGIDVNKRNVVIAYPSISGNPKFEKIERRYDDFATISILQEKFIRKGIRIIVFENPRILFKDLLLSKNYKGLKKAKDILFFLKKLRMLGNSGRVKTILIDPKNTSKICPKCKRRMKIFGIHNAYCPNCKSFFDRDEVASWNILNRGIAKIMKESGKDFHIYKFEKLKR